MFKYQHLSLHPGTFTVDELLRYVRTFAKNGGNGVLLDYAACFPYSGKLASVVDDSAYTTDEVKTLAADIKSLGLDLWVKGISFSHAGTVLSSPEYAHLRDGGGSCNLCLEDSVELMVESTRQLLALHPDCCGIHLGGDEITPFATAPESHAFLIKHGAGALYVDYLNRLMSRLDTEHFTYGVWSDMLIRYPEALDQLNRKVRIFYWDYWGYGDRTAYVSLGGGCRDFVLLDHDAMPRDLAKIFLNSGVRPAADITVGLAERYKDYWQMAPDGKSVRSFPYVSFFKDKGFSVLSSCLTYPEKGSFLSNYAEKLDHLRGFAKRTREANGEGMLSCYWAPFWNDLRLLELIQPIYLALAENPSLSDEEVYAKCCPAGWTPDLFRLYCNIANDFEFNDVLTTEWGTAVPQKQLDWIRRSGRLADETARCTETAKLASEFLSRYSTDDLFRYTVKEVAFRATLQLEAMKGSLDRAVRLAEWNDLEAQYRAILPGMVRQDCLESHVNRRFAPIRSFLEASN